MHRDENVGDEDLVRIHFNHPGLTSGDIKANLQCFVDLTSETINRRLSEIAQSKEGLHDAKCWSCHKTMERQNPHVCDGRVCFMCSKTVTKGNNHMCYIRVALIMKVRKNR